MNIDYTSHFDNDETAIAKELEELRTDIDDVEEVEEEKTMMGIVANTREVYVRSHPAKTSDPITTVKEGIDVLITGVEEPAPGDTWYAVTTENGQDGFIMSNFIEIVD